MQDAPRTPYYWSRACKELSRQDLILARLTAAYGPARLESRGDAFLTLARSIVGQQISVHAAQAVWERFATLLPAITPEGVLGLDTDAMRGAGLSGRKVEYLQDLARHFKAVEGAAAHWDHLDDETIIQELVTIRGIGRWTAQMFLIFHLMRPDVLPLDDVGLLRAMGQHYLSGRAASRHQARKISAAWAPWRSVATWYMWRSLDPLPVAY